MNEEEKSYERRPQILFKIYKCGTTESLHISGWLKNIFLLQKEEEEKMQTEEVPMNEKCHRLRSSLSVALPYRSNSFVGKVPQKRNSLSMTLLVHRHFL